MTSQPRTIVVGTDYSSFADAALRAAYEQARRAPVAELHIVHVSLAESAAESLSPVPFAGLGAVPVQNLAEQKAALVRHVDQVLATLPEFASSGVRVIAHIVLDSPAFGLTRLASALEAELIVVGSHGRGALARWLLGSVAEAVVRSAPCPVLVIPPSTTIEVPAIEPPCPQCVAARRASAGRTMWCEQHSERHARRHTYHQGDRVGAETNLPLVVR